MKKYQRLLSFLCVFVTVAVIFTGCTKRNDINYQEKEVDYKVY